jgi:hypothetical protein
MYAKSVLILGFISSCLMGCAKSPPNCDSSDVQDLVKEILVDSAKDRLVASKILQSMQTHESGKELLYKTLLEMPEIQSMSLGRDISWMSYSFLEKIENNQVVDDFLKEVDSDIDKVALTLEAIRTDKKDSEIKKTICSATVRADDVTDDIRYSAQYTEDGELYAEVGNP